MAHIGVTIDKTLKWSVKLEERVEHSSARLGTDWRGGKETMRDDN